MSIADTWDKMTTDEKLTKLKNANAWGYLNWNSVAKWSELTPHVKDLLLLEECNN